MTLATRPKSPARDAHYELCDCGMKRPEPNYWHRDPGNHSTGCAFMGAASRASLAHIEAVSEWERQAKEDIRNRVPSDIAKDYVNYIGLLDQYGELSRAARFLYDLAFPE